MSTKFINKNLLIVCHSYRSFVKDMVEAMSKHFKNVYILVRLNPIYNIIPIESLKTKTIKYKIDLTNKPSNIIIIPTNVFYLPFRFSQNNLGNNHFKAVDKQIQKYDIKFDLIHAHFTWSSGYVAAKLKEKYNVPAVVTAHGFDIYDLPFRDDEWKKKIEYVLNTADCIITVSNSNLRCIEKLDVDTPVKVIPNGFNDKIFHRMNSEECRKTLNFPINKKIILTAGNLVEVKGHKYLIEAMREVVNHKKNVLCIIVGSGKLKNKMENQISKCGLKDYIKLVGGEPHSQIPIWMNTCDVFVLPSLRESFGVVQIEAMACGKPVVATFNGGSEEIITSDDYGFLVEPANSKNLARQILTALDKEWDYEKIEKYAERFRWENSAKEILGVYREIIK